MLRLHYLIFHFVERYHPLSPSLSYWSIPTEHHLWLFKKSSCFCSARYIITYLELWFSFLFINIWVFRLLAHFRVFLYVLFPSSNWIRTVVDDLWGRPKYSRWMSPPGNSAETTSLVLPSPDDWMDRAKWEAATVRGYRQLGTTQQPALSK